MRQSEYLEIVKMDFLSLAHLTESHVHILWVKILSKIIAIDIELTLLKLFVLRTIQIFRVKACCVTIRAMKIRADRVKNS